MDECLHVSAFAVVGGDIVVPLVKVKSRLYEVSVHCPRKSGKCRRNALPFMPSLSSTYDQSEFSPSLTLLGHLVWLVSAFASASA